MGHSDYGILQRYVRLATERDLGSRADWLELIASNPAMEWNRRALRSVRRERCLGTSTTSYVAGRIGSSSLTAWVYSPCSSCQLSRMG